MDIMSVNSWPVWILKMRNLTQGGGVIWRLSLSPNPHILARMGCCATSRTNRKFPECKNELEPNEGIVAAELDFSDADKDALLDAAAAAAAAEDEDEAAAAARAAAADEEEEEEGM